MKRTLVPLLTAALLFIPAHQLPAPIQEIPESPTPAAEQSPKTKRSSAKPKSTPPITETTKSAVKQPIGAKTSRFAGKWVGTMPEVPWGNVATELIVDETGTTMQWQESGKQKGTEKARLFGDMLQATFQVGVAAIWSLTPQPDGVTARVRLQAFMNDQTVVFHRVAGSIAAKTAR
jgi:hypothetical protein